MLKYVLPKILTYCPTGWKNQFRRRGGLSDLPTSDKSPDAQTNRNENPDEKSQKFFTYFSTANLFEKPLNLCPGDGLPNCGTVRNRYSQIQMIPIVIDESDSCSQSESNGVTKSKDSQIIYVNSYETQNGGKSVLLIQFI